MTDTEKQSSLELDGQGVANYLIDHPDFFSHYPDLLTRIDLPEQNNGTLSLVTFQQQKQREKITELEEEVTRLMMIASRNDQLFHLFSKIQLILLSEQISQKNVEDCLVYLSDQLHLKTSLRLFADVIPSLPLQWLLDPSGYRDVDKEHIQVTQIYLGRLTSKESALFFESSVQFGSFAILPLHYQLRHLGFLAFASDDSNYFRSEQGTLIIDQFASLFAQILVNINKQGR